jgi:hypothetical protein
MTINSNHNHLFTDLDESEMAATTGGTNAAFLDRWAARAIKGNPNIGRIVQRVVNDYETRALNTTNVAKWFATTSPANAAAWRSLAPAALNYINSGGAVAVKNPATLAAARSFLGNIV